MWSLYEWHHMNHIECLVLFLVHGKSSIRRSYFLNYSIYLTLPFYFLWCWALNPGFPLHMPGKCKMLALSWFLALLIILIRKQWSVVHISFWIMVHSIKCVLWISLRACSVNESRMPWRPHQGMAKKPWWNVPRETCFTSLVSFRDWLVFRGHFVLKIGWLLIVGFRVRSVLVPKAPKVPLGACTRTHTYTHIHRQLDTCIQCVMIKSVISIFTYYRLRVGSL